MIFHILKRDEWTHAVASGRYSPPSLAVEGFIHCSTIDQLIGTANGFFHGQDGLAVLCIEEHLLTAPLKLEPPADAADARAKTLFPHIHGPLNLDAVAKVIDFPCEADGSFRMPDKLGNVAKSGV
ncbi:MAG TPA: DUF952 domain-containing protein [Candidatus Binataceae bacterium]|nr:DUF952 domain-containing protein [Candidatus Binataceae bacterium]